MQLYYCMMIKFILFVNFRNALEILLLLILPLKTIVGIPQLLEVLIIFPAIKVTMPLLPMCTLFMMPPVPMSWLRSLLLNAIMLLL